MLTIEIICIGRLKENYLREACGEYTKRLSAWVKCRITELDEERLPDNPSQSVIDSALEAEGNRILKTLAKLPKGSDITALCIEGGQCGSQAFAELFTRAMNNGSSTAAFVIGGSYGLSPEVKAATGRRLSMSQMTFPHQLARVMLLEQIYRAQSILNGGKYHK